MFDPKILTDQQRRGYMLAHVYERIRKRKQKGYKVFQYLDASIATSPILKTFATVVGWLDAQGWKVSWDETHWQGFVEYVFESFGSTTPMPGQLKNPVLLRRYISSAKLVEVEPLRSPEEMQAIYKDVLRGLDEDPEKLIPEFGLDDAN